VNRYCCVPRSGNRHNNNLSAVLSSVPTPRGSIDRSDSFPHSQPTTKYSLWLLWPSHQSLQRTGANQNYCEPHFGDFFTMAADSKEGLLYESPSAEQGTLIKVLVGSVRCDSKGLILVNSAYSRSRFLPRKTRNIIPDAERCIQWLEKSMPAHVEEVRQSPYR
jgi:hypothetical protein